MMAPEVYFFKDFDSFTLESDYLEIVYGSNPFRFGYAANHADRKFFIKSLGKIEITLPEILLQYEDQAGFGTAYLVNLCAEFEDALKFGSFVEKLTSVAGYHQVQPPDCDLSTNTTSDSEDEDDMNESDIQENILNQHHLVRSESGEEMDLPLFVFKDSQSRIQGRIQGQALQFTFAQAYFEVLHPGTGQSWRFLHAVIGNRQYQTLANVINRSRYLVKDLTLQAKKARGRGLPQYMNVGTCEVELDLASTNNIHFFRRLTDPAYGYQPI